MSDRNYFSKHLVFRIRGFTLVEMLIAMTITMLMMVAVARAFAFVGERVRDSRGNLALSSDLRDITTRLDDELRRCTVSLDPVDGDDEEPSGYFLYHEGPCTDATSTLFGRQSTDIVDGSTVAQDSRFGDVDDYLAFTAVASPGTWFTGQVPAYILDPTLDPTTGPAAEIAAKTSPVIIRSRYAEIIYFANPERDSTGAVVDTDGDLIADRLLLYRRVLLIRPDLNLDTANNAILRLTAGTNWQTGMANIHQLLDLSVRRKLLTDGRPNLTATARVVANTLADLSKPHNRFAHVRVPWSGVISTGSANDTSMPILALEAPIDLIRNQTDGTETGTPPSFRPPWSGTSTEPVITPVDWSGYLRREFVLNGDRSGEDVIANNCRALDIQIFDSTAPFYLPSNDPLSNSLVVGPSDAGFRDALQGVNATSPRTPVMVPGGGFVDLCYPLLAGGPMRGWQTRRLATSAPSPAPVQPDTVVAPDLLVADDNVNWTTLQSDFSGLQFTPSGSPPQSFPTLANDKVYSDSLLKSGRVVINQATGRIVLFQPAFDTFTSSYERDGFYQSRRYGGTPPQLRGTFWEQYDPVKDDRTDLGADGLDSRTSSTYFPVVNGKDDFHERETSAPFLIEPEAIRITVRLENVGTRQLRQSSVVHRGDR